MQTYQLLGSSKCDKAVWNVWRCKEYLFSHGVDFNVYTILNRFCEGGELFDRIIDKGFFTESEARVIFR